MDEIGRPAQTKKKAQLKQGPSKEFRRAVKRGYKLTPDDLPQIDYRYFDHHDIRSHPVKHSNGWVVSFWIMYPDDPHGSLSGHFGTYLDRDVKSTIGEAHQIGFAIARAIISGQPPEKLTDFTETEREEIQRFHHRLEFQRIKIKLKAERAANPIPISTKYLIRLELSEKQLRNLLRIAVSTFTVFEHELFFYVHSLRELFTTMTEQIGIADSTERMQDCVERLPLLIDILESLMRTGGEYSRYGWPGEDPFITRPMQVLEDVRKRFSQATISVTDDSAQSLDLIYPRQTLFTIFHELISNAVKHSCEPLPVRIAWRVQDEKFICEIQDGGPGVCDDLSATYLGWWKLRVGPTGRGLAIVGHALIASHSYLSFCRSAELGVRRSNLSFRSLGIGSMTTSLCGKMCMRLALHIHLSKKAQHAMRWFYDGPHQVSRMQV